MTDQAPSDWPSGTVALVFTDVERSTELWQIDEDAFSWALMEHDNEVREALGEHRGIEVKHTGDGFFLCFEQMADAAGFSLALQTRLTAHEWPPELGAVRTRIGVHYGRPLLHGRDYRGAAVSVAYRICEASAGGRILMSGDAADALQDTPELAARAQYLGSHDLPGINGGTDLYELTCDATRDFDFPAIGARPPRHEPVTSEETEPVSTFDAEDTELWRRAREALRTADQRTAIAALLELRERYPDEVRVLNSLGVAYAWARQWDRAEECLQRAVAVDPDHASSWFNLARVYGKMGRRDAIGGALARALAADPSHAKARAVAAKYGVDIPRLPS